MKVVIIDKLTGRELDIPCRHISKVNWTPSEDMLHYYFNTYRFNSETGVEELMGSYNSTYYDLILSRN